MLKLIQKCRMPTIVKVPNPIDIKWRGREWRGKEGEKAALGRLQGEKMRVNRRRLKKTPESIGLTFLKLYVCSYIHEYSYKRPV